MLCVVVSIKAHYLKLEILIIASLKVHSIRDKNEGNFVTSTLVV